MATARVVLSSGQSKDDPAVSLEVYIKFFEDAAPEADFGSATGLTVGDLTALSNMLSNPMQNAYASFGLIDLVQQYISDVGAQQQLDTKLLKFDFPWIPNHLVNGTKHARDAVPWTTNTAFVVASLEELVRGVVASRGRWAENSTVFGPASMSSPFCGHWAVRSSKCGICSHSLSHPTPPPPPPLRTA